MSWQDLENAAPELASFGLRRFEVGVAYLGTLRPGGAPRVHPVTPIVGQGHLFVFMEPTSPKGHDLRRDGRYALHSAVSDSNGTSGEFAITGNAVLIVDPVQRALASQLASYTPADRYILFELEIDSASSTLYNDGKPVRQRWER
jgi:hypothetical protein